jgi:hypothetical protein
VAEVVTVEDITGWDADLRAPTDGLGWMFNRPEPKVSLGLMMWDADALPDHVRVEKRCAARPF